MKQKAILESIDRLIRGNDTCVLATTSEKEPHTSLMVYTSSPDCRTLFLVTSRQTKKYLNLVDNPNVSILIDTRCEDDTEAVRALTIRGIASEMGNTAAWAAVRHQFIEKRPGIAELLDNPDTAIFSVSVKSVQMLSGFRDSNYILFE